MKIGPVTKIDKGNKARSREFYEFSESCEVIVFLLIYSQFGAIWVVDPRLRNYKTYIFNSSNPLSKITENITKKFVAQLSYYCFE